MRHRRNYADVKDAEVGRSRHSNIGFLGIPRIGSALGPATILAAIALVGFLLGTGFEGISWPLG